MSLAEGNIVVSVFLDMPTPGALGAFARPEKINEIQELEKSKTSRLWDVRAFVSDHVPLAGNPPDTLKEAGHHFLHVNPAENPLWIYLHAGGRRAVYYGLFNDANGKLDYIVVKVQSPCRAMRSCSRAGRSMRCSMLWCGTIPCRSSFIVWT
jgi:hypothetical protein